MAEYGSDEERFSALINFFKDNKNIIGISSLGSCFYSYFLAWLQVL